ncbi:MAG TPA: tail fiber domain-containing protein [Thermoanaerobaculia bacterium]|nr:tail fiber domain-containing protein [Thermoanaerobaculia bacterium]
MVALLAVTAPAAWAGAASLSVDPGRAQWDVQGDYERAVLSVSMPDGEVVRREFDGRETPVFDLASGAKDGAYTYELRLVPRISASMRQALAEARKSGDEAAIAKLRAELPESPVFSGSFLVQAGSIQMPEGPEPPATGGRKVTTSASGTPRNMTAADQVIPDDLIVQGSLCVGFDCVNNESFGFDTIRLKENNTRIKFEDTSVGTFPTNDWQITANDSASGGSSKFSIEDITGSRVPFTITAGASTNSIFVDSTGRVGFRTSTPVLDLHVNTSNTPAIRLEQNNSGGFTAQTWDIGANEANFFVRDVTGGSLLSFRIRPGAPTSSVDISADGDVGVGTGSPSQKLHVAKSQNANTIALVENTTAGLEANAVWQAKSDTAQTNFQAHSSARTATRFGKSLGGMNELLGAAGNGLLIGTLNNTAFTLGTNNTNRIEIAAGGAVTVAGNLTVNGTFSNPSSRSLKEGFQTVDPSTMLEKFAQLPILEWSYKSDEQKLRHVGPTVEDFRNAFGLGTEGKYIFPMDVQGVTMAAVQGLYKEVQEKDAQIAELQKQIEEIKQLLKQQAEKQ